MTNMVDMGCFLTVYSILETNHNHKNENQTQGFSEVSGDWTTKYSFASSPSILTPQIAHEFRFTSLVLLAGITDVVSSPADWPTAGTVSALVLEEQRQ